MLLLSVSRPDSVQSSPRPHIRLEDPF